MTRYTCDGCGHEVEHAHASHLRKWTLAEVAALGVFWMFDYEVSRKSCGPVREWNDGDDFVAWAVGGGWH